MLPGAYRVMGKPDIGHSASLVLSRIMVLNTLSWKRTLILWTTSLLSVVLLSNMHAIIPVTSRMGFSLSLTIWMVLRRVTRPFRARIFVSTGTKISLVAASALIVINPNEGGQSNI